MDKALMIWTILEKTTVAIGGRKNAS